MGHSFELKPDDPRRKTYIEMWRLVQQYRWIQTPPLFSNELILAICWEETTFRNIAQLGGGPAFGYGQLEPSALELINVKYKLGMRTEQLRQLMQADAFSVQFIGRALHTLHDNMRDQNAKHRKEQNWAKIIVDLKRGVLLYGYGGHSGKFKAGWRREAVAGWVKCEEILRGAKKHPPGGVPSRSVAREALTAATLPTRRGKGEAWEQMFENVLAGLPD